MRDLQSFFNSDNLLLYIIHISLCYQRLAFIMHIILHSEETTWKDWMQQSNLKLPTGRTNIPPHVFLLITSQKLFFYFSPVMQLMLSHSMTHWLGWWKSKEETRMKAKLHNLLITAPKIQTGVEQGLLPLVICQASSLASYTGNIKRNQFGNQCQS